MRKKTHEEFVGEIKDRTFEVIGEYKRSDKKLKFKCNIDGHIWEAVPSNILRGGQCPCCANRNRKKNNRILANHGTWLEVDVSTKTYKEKVMTIDVADFDFIKSLGSGRFTATGRCNTVYVSCTIDGKSMLVHRLIIPGAKEIDHKNGIGLDNRFSNLRDVTSSQNQMNKSFHRTGETKGAYLDKRHNKWFSSIRANGTRKHLGTFDTKKEAADAYKRASLELHGEYSYFNREIV